MDVILLNEPWVREAIQHPKIGSDGLPYIDLPYLVLMKLSANRIQDLADISRMLGGANEDGLRKTRSVIKKYPDYNAFWGTAR
jgi:hypothetical protein